MKSEKEYHKDDGIDCVLPLWKWTDLDQINIWRVFVSWRLFQCLFLTFNMAHPDEYWQAIEPAYNMIYGGVELPWEWRSEYKLRSALYPSYLAIPLWCLKTL